MESMKIQSSRGSYNVYFEECLESLIADLAKIENTLVVIDAKVLSGFRQALQALPSKRPWLTFDATEEDKTLAGCEKILSALVENNANRDTKIIAIGGGIVQDVVTLCAHLYFRGIEWVYVPTTMLAMTDSCIGAKASINFQGYKNQLGVFHSPYEVHICTAFLETLPEEQLKSGFGEAFKLYFASTPREFFELADTIEVEGWRTSSVGKIIRRSLEIKKRYIEIDEFDRGIRRHLNYGHTFGHALESVTNHGVPHGLAICWGMDLVNFLALSTGRIDQAFFDATHSRLRKLFSTNLKEKIPSGLLLAATKRDKKNSGAELTLVMPRSDGVLELVRQNYNDTLTHLIETYLTAFSIIAETDPTLNS